MPASGRQTDRHQAKNAHHADCSRFRRLTDHYKDAFLRLRRTRHTAQYFDPAAAPVTESDAAWAIEKAAAAVSAVGALLRAGWLDPFG